MNFDIVLAPKAEPTNTAHNADSPIKSLFTVNPYAAMPTPENKLINDITRVELVGLFSLINSFRNVFIYYIWGKDSESTMLLKLGFCIIENKMAFLLWVS